MRLRGGGIAFESDVNQPVTGTLLHNTIVGNDRGSGNGRIGIYSMRTASPWL